MEPTAPEQATQAADPQAQPQPELEQAEAQQPTDAPQPEAEAAQPTDAPQPEVEAAQPTDAPQPEAEAAQPAPAADNTDWKDKYLRLAAEYDNFRKRTQREKLDLFADGKNRALLALIPSVDNLMRAITAAQTADSVEKVREGLELVLRKLVKDLEKEGVTMMDAKGQAFDSEFHEAITSMPAPDDDHKGKVLEVIENGYLIHDVVLKHAKVIIGE
jgi:molecular chaperone GrpE